LTPLDDICGQSIAKKILLNSLNRNRLASTYLFYGCDGLGKWSMAIAMAALVNCENPVRDESGRIADACGKCRNCHQILNLGFPELNLAVPIPPHKKESDAVPLMLEFLEQKKKEPYRIITSTRQLTIPIHIARRLKRDTAMKPPEGVKRLILFYQMEKMLPSSADSLLKLIEEPPPETIIVLSAVNPDNLLPTVRSRAHKIAFKPIPIPEITGYLQARDDLSASKSEFYAGLAEGSIGRALALIEDDSESSIRQVAFLMFKALFYKDNPSAVATINEFLNINNRGEVEQILSVWQSFLSDLVVLRYGKEPSQLLNTDMAGELENMASKIIAVEGFCDMSDNIKEMISSVRRNVHIRPAMTSLVLNLRGLINQSA
jgi:DNA polymerase-3 subunit delta'